MDESSVGICFQNMGNMRRVSSGVPGTIEKKKTHFHKFALKIARVI